MHEGNWQEPNSEEFEIPNAERAFLVGADLNAGYLPHWFRDWFPSEQGDVTYRLAGLYMFVKAC